MLFKNMEIHGVGELITDKETGVVKWLRVCMWQVFGADTAM